ncbi:angiomotin-like 2a isoform X2 [Eucyclogobius newberryi]|uniref:angiomotin-like 2a isoform X2 n=1 Tax=Eucyclogobius newberryi TaxID=166745 RepID=UPI003B5A31D5
MRTAEDSSGTVLHRLIQEQLRYANMSDARTLLAIQQQALRGGSSSGGGTGSPRSSLESLTQDDSPYIYMNTRQEPQGEEYQGEGLSESPLYHLHTEELPTYEEARLLISQKGLDLGPEEQWDMKREHVRSLSERLMQLSLERSAARQQPLPCSLSYPQLYSTGLAPGQSVEQRAPPPQYSCPTKLPGYMLSHSQETQGQYYREPPPFYSQHRYNTPPSPQSEALQRENERLKKELEVVTEKASRLQKLEVEIQRISEAYDTLMKGSAKKESLEKTMRNKLEAEIKRLHDFNRDLREQLESATKQRANKETESSDPKHHVFVKLLEQNEEQQRERERLEKQVLALRVYAEESQRRRDTMEQALSSAQTRSRLLEEELHRKRAYVQKVEGLQSSLAQLQAACKKRETLELRLRTRLEQELKSLRAQQKQTSTSTSSEVSASTLEQQLREKEERILALEADITKWEQKYLEESTMRQFAMDAAATAAAQRDTTIIKHSPRTSPNSSFNEDLPLANHRNQEMANRIRALHAQLLEKDAVIQVLHHRSKLEQGRLENQGLRLARSVPSINTASSATAIIAKKSLSDDQTGAARGALLLTPKSAVLRRDRGTQSEASPVETEADMPQESEAADAFDESTQEPKANALESEMVEILI